ncbi:translesion DNA synthesis-associated protein ImuA [Thiohalomonas denitrificans]|uniref:translesion DNA synthesis-associated protein ImuA n=1 Tax=Thiohalomonas denitrificans TaxID=415747 RepID=UPI0026F368AF|nr:translesion DNA synthesis-associated protein ImuA [Thiohalomonas denitrificans]
MNLNSLLTRADIWRGRDTSPQTTPHLSTGHPALDERLGGGWPVGALTEILVDQKGIGELRLLTPALAHLSRAYWQAWIAPPHIPYAPALAAAGIDLQRLVWIRTCGDDQTLWSLEQSLRSGVCGAVLGWPGRADNRALRRLQLAAEHGEASGFLFRPRQEAHQPSPAAVRLELELEHDTRGLTVHILKRRGGWAGQPVVLSAA